MSAKIIKILLLALAVVVAVMAFIRFNRVTLPGGAVPVVWDSEVCGHCKMHVGDPRFAAQLQTSDGDVLNFDDPGCLFDYLDAHDVSLHAVYFRDHLGDDWLSQTEAAFLPADDTPMGYGIRAVPQGTPDAQDWDWAKGIVKSRPHHQHGAP